MLGKGTGGEAAGGIILIGAVKLEMLRWQISAMSAHSGAEREGHTPRHAGPPTHMGPEPTDSQPLSQPACLRSLSGRKVSDKMASMERLLGGPVQPFSTLESAETPQPPEASSPRPSQHNIHSQSPGHWRLKSAATPPHGSSGALCSLDTNNPP